MTIRSDKLLAVRDPAFTAFFALAAMAFACAIVLFAVPRAVPAELPVLRLDQEQVRAQLAHDDMLASRAQGRLPQELYRVLLEAGRSEFERDAALAPKAEILATLKRRATSELGASGLQAVRAFAARRFMQALREGLPDEAEEHGVVGAQYSFLRQHGYIAESGTLLAPELSVRATYKVRWNMLFGFEPSAGLSPIERAAYEGFRALEAYYLPDEVRSAALRELSSLQPDARVREAALLWQAQRGDLRPLWSYVQEAGFGAVSLRLRNMALGYLSPQP